MGREAIVIVDVLTTRSYVPHGLHGDRENGSYLRAMDLFWQPCNGEARKPHCIGDVLRKKPDLP